MLSDSFFRKGPGILMCFYLLGFGAVGQSFLRILRENHEFDRDSFYVIDANPSLKTLFREAGGREDHFHAFRVTEENFEELLRCLQPDDYFADLSEEFRNLLILQYCLDHGIHYLSASDSSWSDETEAHSIYNHYLEFRKAQKTCPEDAATSIIEFGMNPGLVSAFVRAAIDDIVEQDSSSFVEENREALRGLIHRKNYAKAASLLKIRKIIEADNDDQMTDIPFEEGVLYSTWNAHGFQYECLTHPQIAFGREEELRDYGNAEEKRAVGQYAILKGRALDCTETVWSPQGWNEGYLTAHEEIFPIRDFLRTGNYAPTVYFVYSPGDYAKRSLSENADRKVKKYHVIRKEEIISGGESVGMILSGENFQTRYFGNYLRNENAAESATAVQVSASLFAAYKYIQNHPRLGMLFPEEVDHREVLKTAKKELGEYISKVL